MKTIKFIHRYRGWKDANPHGGEAHQPDDIVICEEPQANWWVKNDWAILVKESKPETAVVKLSGETAVVKMGKPRGRPPKNGYQQPPHRASSTLTGSGQSPEA